MAAEHGVIGRYGLAASNAGIAANAIETPRAQIKAISFGILVEHYRLKEMSEGSGKTFATRETYEGYLRNGFFHGGIRIVSGI